MRRTLERPIYIGSLDGLSKELVEFLYDLETGNDKAIKSTFDFMESCTPDEFEVATYFIGESNNDIRDSAYATSHIARRVMKTLERFKNKHSKSFILNSINKLLEDDAKTRRNSFKIKIEE